MLLPWEYGVRNLARKPLRTTLTLLALSTVVLLVFAVVGFIRGLSKSLANSGDPEVMLIYSVNSEENIENSSIAAQTPALLTASIEGTWARFDVDHVSPEIYMGTRMQVGEEQSGFGLVRAVTRRAPLVRRSVQLTSGEWPGSGEVIVGCLAHTKLGCTTEDLAIGNTIGFEGTDWTIVGQFEAQGAAYESELWCDLNEFRSATKRQDLSLVALLLEKEASKPEIELFCKERTDLELRAQPETAYYDSLQKHYRPVQMLGWLIVVLVAGAGVFAGLNMMYGAVAGRVRELATLQAIGFRRRAILLSIMQEGVLLAAASSLISGLVALVLLDGTSIRFTMGAFALVIDGFSVAIGCGVGLMLGVLGSIPPALKALRMQVGTGLKAL